MGPIIPSIVWYFDSLIVVYMDPLGEPQFQEIPLSRFFRGPFAVYQSIRKGSRFGDQGPSSGHLEKDLLTAYLNPKSMSNNGPLGL